MKNWERNFPNKSPWTREEVARLRELLNDGVPLDSKREHAIALGAEPISRQQLVELIRRARRETKENKDAND